MTAVLWLCAAITAFVFIAAICANARAQHSGRAHLQFRARDWDGRWE